MTSPTARPGDGLDAREHSTPGSICAMDALSSRVLLHPTDHARSVAFYRDTLGLGVAREFGPAEAPGVVFFVGNGLLELSGGAAAEPTATAVAQSAGATPSTRPSAAPAGAPQVAFALWIQVRDVARQHDRLAAAGVRIDREPRQEPWGLIECWIADPDGVPIVLVEVPADHPLRRDSRPAPTTA